MHADQHGLAVTAESAEAVAHFDAAVTEYVGFKLDPVAHVKRALAADPGFPLALVLRGYFYLMLGVPAVLPKVLKCMTGAEASATTPREKGHVAALRAWCGGDLTGALARWENILIEHPTDLLALRLAHGLHFDLGDSLNLRDSVARVLPAWEEGQPGHGYALGMHAFGLEECGGYAAAEATGRRAVEIDPSDIWAVHAVTHIMEMQGRQREGIAWLAGLEPHWTGCNFFVHHVWWHCALFRIDLGDDDAALALYDDRVRDDFSEIVYDMIDAASLLWRLELAGIDVGERWAELADKSEARIDDHPDTFSDVHFMMGLAATGRTAAIDAMLASMGRYASTGTATMATVTRDVGINACAALAAYRGGEYDLAVDLLMPLRYALQRIGGSHAQRDLFTQTLIEATLQAGRFPLARALLAERTALKPNSPRAWNTYARALEGLGDTAAAQTARESALALAVA